jgi:hypothetical protein
MDTIFTVDRINSILLAHATEEAGMAEPLNEMHPLEYAELIGEDLCDEIYPLADSYPQAENEWIDLAGID